MKIERSGSDDSQDHLFYATLARCELRGGGLLLFDTFIGFFISEITDFYNQNFMHKVNLFCLQKPVLGPLRSGTNSLQA